MRSLNPCSNGRYSQRMIQNIKRDMNVMCLNPCSNGRYSQRNMRFEFKFA